MVSYLITSKDKSKREQCALELCNKNGIDPLDITVFDKDTLEKKDKKVALSIGIDDIKYLQHKIFLKPIKSQTKAIIINDAQLLTIEAQNAMLKVLEETPPNTLIFLTADTKEVFLPTILSRCQLIEIKTEKQLSTDDKTELQNTIKQLGNITVSECLSLAQTLSKNKDTAVDWLENMILILREQLLDSVEQGSEAEINRCQFMINNFQTCYTTVKTTNINLRLTLEHLFLSLL
jgi:DNA polymerase III delta prime subunit